MEEQGESVFREDGWLPTTFILKEHHLYFLTAEVVSGSRTPLSTRFPADCEQEWQRMFGAWLLMEGFWMDLGSAFAGAVACGDRQAGNVWMPAQGPRRSEPQHQLGVANPRATWSEWDFEGSPDGPWKVIDLLPDDQQRKSIQHHKPQRDAVFGFTCSFAGSLVLLHFYSLLLPFWDEGLSVQLQSGFLVKTKITAMTTIIKPDIVKR